MSTVLGHLDAGAEDGVTVPMLLNWEGGVQGVVGLKQQVQDLSSRGGLPMGCLSASGCAGGLGDTLSSLLPRSRGHWFFQGVWHCCVT